VAAACAHALAGADASWCGADDARRALTKLYLSEEHCANPGGGCAFAAVGAEFARLAAPARGVMTTSLREEFDALAAALEGGPAARRREAISTFAGLVGTLILARGVDDDALRGEILASGRAVFGGRGLKEGA